MTGRSVTANSRFWTASLSTSCIQDGGRLRTEPHRSTSRARLLASDFAQPCNCNGLGSEEDEDLHSSSNSINWNRHPSMVEVNMSTTHYGRALDSARHRPSLITTKSDGIRGDIAEELDAQMRQRWEKVVCRELGVPDTYDQVAVLIIHWEEGLDQDLRVGDEVTSLSIHAQNCANPRPGEGAGPAVPERLPLQFTHCEAQQSEPAPTSA